MRLQRRERQKVEGLFQRFDVDRGHAQQVEGFCDRIYCTLPHLHGLTKTSRELLETTALLHDIAEASGKERHDLRGARRLRKARLPFIQPGWKAMMAQAVALHSNKSDIASFLARLERTRDPRMALAGRLAAILRIADGLDHERKQDTSIAAIVDDGQGVTIYLAPSACAQANAEFAMKKADLWNRLALRPIRQIKVIEDEILHREVLDPEEDIGKAACAILKRQFEQVVSREYGLSYKQDVEYVHEIRVALRRATVVLDSFVDHLRAGSRRLAREISRDAQSLGDVRDLDVFLEYLDEYYSHAPASHRRTLQKIRQPYQRRRQQQYRQVLHDFSGPDYDRFKSRFSIITTPPTPGESSPRPELLRRQASKVLLACLDKIHCYPKRLSRLDVKRQHELRIDCKNLRYLAEFFRGLYEGRIDEMIEAMTSLQDLLGQAHDVDVYIEWLTDEKASVVPSRSKVLRDLLKDLHCRRQACLKQASGIWKPFHRRRTRRPLMRVLRTPLTSSN